MAARQAQTRGMVSLAEAAELAGVSIRTLRRRIADGALPAYRTGPRLIRVHPDDLLTIVVPMNTVAAERLQSDSGPLGPGAAPPTAQRRYARSAFTGR